MNDYNHHLEPPNAVRVTLSVITQTLPSITITIYSGKGNPFAQSYSHAKVKTTPSH